MQPYFKFKNPRVLSSLVKYDIIDTNGELRRFDNVVVHDLLVLIVQVFQFVENVVHDNNSHYITNYSESSQMDLVKLEIITRGHWDLYLVVHAFGYYNPLNTGDIMVIDPIVAIV